METNIISVKYEDDFVLVLLMAENIHIIPTKH